MSLYGPAEDIVFGDPNKTYYVDDTVRPDQYSDEDEVVEEVRNFLGFI